MCPTTNDSPNDRGPLLLQVTSSPRRDSVTNALSNAYADAWASMHPGSRVIRHDLPALDLPHLSATEMGAWFTDTCDHTDLHRLVLARSDALIEDLLAADEVVIGAPMWNFSIPSNLKAWIDHVTKEGKTFRFGPEGPVGMVPARRAVVVSARGSDYRPGTPTAPLDLQEPYLRLILGFLGIDHVEVINVDRQGPSYPDAADYAEEARSLLLTLAEPVG
jgi:FMN-dependent NADH-azoreductase